MNLKESLITDKFLARWTKNFKGDWDGCWVWHGAVTENTPVFSIKNHTYDARRISLWLSTKDVPDGMLINSLCGNRLCVNPEHIILETREERTSRHFWDKMSLDIDTGCWNWSGCSRSIKKYGGFGFNGSVYPAHRVAWILTYGEIPDGLLVCHRCDNPKCINPMHLFLGTTQDNVNDMMKKGRGAFKITQLQAQSIRDLFSSGIDRKELAKEFHLSYSHICQIVENNHWKE